MQKKTHYLSLWQATLINLNIMFGSGIFINTVTLATLAGFFGFISYALVALILLPLIITMMLLVEHYPIGGFYAYAANTLSPFWGFLSAWSYAIGKLASAMLLIHIFSLLLLTIVVPLQTINPFIIDSLILLMFMWLNYYGLKTGVAISYVFLLLKLTPILFIILSSLSLITHWSIPPSTFLLHNIQETIPFVLYAFFGFEAACSLSLTIDNAKHNAPRVIFYSFAISVLLTVFYQCISFLTIGPELMKQKAFLDILPTLFNTLFAQPSATTNILLHFLHSCVAVAALGGSYGMILSNSWNIYTLAEHGHLPVAHLFTKKNKFNVPFGAIVAQIIICFCYLTITGGHQKTLQQISVFGCTIAFMLSTLSAIVVGYKEKKYGIWMSIITHASLGSCLLLFATCLRNFFITGTIYLLLFSVILLCGILLYSYMKYKVRSN